MITFAMPARNARDWTAYALTTITHAINELHWREQVEVLLLDDASEPEMGIVPAFQEFRAKSGLPTTILRFKKRQHYSRVLSAALSFARGEKIFFLSNDMVFTPDFFRTLLEVSNLDPTIGIVRGTSNHTDSHPEHTVNPPFPMRTFIDVLNFSQYAFVYWGQHFVEDHILSGDAVLFNRALINKIGVVDTQYYGYFGDVDYGLRTMRAGFKLVCAKGAWLLHQGAGYVKDEAISTKTEFEPHYATRMKTVREAYALYRQKWDLNLPESSENAPIASPHLKKIEPLNLHEYFPPVVLTPDLAEIV